MASEHHIPAELVLLCIVARKANPRCRLAAVTGYTWSPSCSTRFGGNPPRPRFPPLLTPMQRGYLHRAIERQRLTQGLASIRKTFGVGLRAVLAEPAYVVPVEGASE